MNDDQRNEWAVIRVRAAIVCAELRLEGMRAENAMRAIQGYSPAFVEHHFEEVIRECGIGSNDVITAFQEAQ